MAHIDRDDAIKRIRKALKTLTGKSWSVRGSRGTAWGWIKVCAPPRRCTWDWVQDGEDDAGYPKYKPVHAPEKEFGYMGPEDRLVLGKALGYPKFPGDSEMVHTQGESVSPDSREWFVETLEERARRAGKGAA